MKWKLKLAKGEKRVEAFQAAYPILFINLSFDLKNWCLNNSPYCCANLLDSTIKKIMLTSVTEFFLKIFHFMCPWKYLSLCFRRWLNKHEPVYQALWANNTDFDEVLISPVMIQDHMPDKVLDSLNRVSYRLKSPSDNFF